MDRTLGPKASGRRMWKTNFQNPTRRHDIMHPGEKMEGTFLWFGTELFGPVLITEAEYLIYTFILLSI
jgi:hypothetical protein